MTNKTLIYVAVGLFILLLIVSLFSFFRGMTGNVIKEDELNLGKYRSEDIPEDCKLPKYQDNVEEWKQHLSHHENTWYCLDYYNASIAEIKEGED